MYTVIATNMERAGDKNRRQLSRLGLCRIHQVRCPQQPRSPFIPAEKAMTVETRGPRPGADRAGMQERTRKLTDTRPHRTARIQKLCVTWI